MVSFLKFEVLQVVATLTETEQMGCLKERQFSSCSTGFIDTWNYRSEHVLGILITFVNEVAPLDTKLIVDFCSWNNHTFMSVSPSCNIFLRNSKHFLFVLLRRIHLFETMHFSKSSFQFLKPL